MAARGDAIDRRTLEAWRAASGSGRPALLTHAVVRPLPAGATDLLDADVLVEAGTVTAVGPGPQASVGSDALLVDCRGAVLLPAAGCTGGGAETVGALVPGAPATFAVLPPPSGPLRPLESLVWYPDQALALVVAGVPRHAGPGGGGAGRPPRTVDSPHLGAWTDLRADVVQELTPAGRYDETRGGRRHAYQGDFWVTGGRIVYRDDLGFWAYGRFDDGVLVHAGFRFRR